MARGRQKAEWERTAQLIAGLYQLHTKEPIDPDRLNPYADRSAPVEKSPEDLAAETKLAVALLRSLAR